MKTKLVLIAIIICGFAAIVGVTQFLDANETPLAPEIADADLSFQAATLRQNSFGFEGLMADYYWMTALQYIGTKIINNGGLNKTDLNNLQSLNPRLLSPLLDTATTLDPDFTTVYIYGAIILPAVNIEDAIKIGEKGIAAQPDKWEIYHQLGYLYWRHKNYARAAEIYQQGSIQPNAPEWMRGMSAKMKADGENRETARQIYRQMLETAPTPHGKILAESNLALLDSQDEREAISAALQNFQAQNKRCPKNWREMILELRVTKLPNGENLRLNPNGEPLDPSDTIYLLEPSENQCRVKIDRPNSKIIADPNSEK